MEKKIDKIVLVFVALTFGIFANANAQKKAEYPEVGKPCPDLVLNNVEYFPKKQVNIKDFKGKWLILDFWSLKCTSCVESFPSVNRNMKKYNQKVQFMMIGAIQGQTTENNNEAVTRKTYAAYRDRLKLEMPCAFDTGLYKRWNLGQLPYVVVIDDKGIVRAITIGLRDQNIEDLIAGKSPRLSQAYRSDQKQEIAFNHNSPMLTNGNGGEDTAYLFRSLLTDWKEEMGVAAVEVNDIDSYISTGIFQVAGMSLEKLYRYAYIGRPGIGWKDTTLYGKVSNQIILEIPDSSLFKWDVDTRKNLFAYSLSMPSAKASRSLFMTRMQHDLADYFGYEVHIEERMMPYYKVVATPEAREKLKAKGDSTYQHFSRYGFQVKNQTVESLFPSNSTDLPIIDETGIDTNVDITVSCIFTDFDDIKRGYHEAGLDFVKSEKLMKAIVIRDPKPSTEQTNASR